MRLIERIACALGMHDYLLIAKGGLLIKRCTRCQHEVFAP